MQNVRLLHQALNEPLHDCEALVDNSTTSSMSEVVACSSCSS